MYKYFRKLNLGFMDKRFYERRAKIGDKKNQF